MFEYLDFEDVVTFTGSAATGQKLKSHPRLREKSIPFTMEADSLTAQYLGLMLLQNNLNFLYLLKK